MICQVSVFHSLEYLFWISSLLVFADVISVSGWIVPTPFSVRGHAPTVYVSACAVEILPLNKITENLV
jgi:hypothetical protein